MPESISSRYVPDIGPEDAQAVLVAEAPGSEEDRKLQPFVGEAGNKLNTVLGRNGNSREIIDAGAGIVRLANLAHYRPPKNHFEALLGTKQLEQGLNDLYNYLREHRPNVVCAMGNWPLFFLTGKKGKKPGTGILNWRGSILECNVKGLEGLKVIPTVHPAAILRDGSLYPVFDQDIKRVIKDSEFPELRLPQRQLVVIRQGQGVVAEFWP